MSAGSPPLARAPGRRASAPPRRRPRTLRAPLLSPTRLLRDGLDPWGRTGQGAFAGVALLCGGLWALRAWGPSTFPGWSRGWEAVAILPLAVLLAPALGHAFRRLNDAGLRGAWAWLLLVPLARWGLVAVLLLRPASQRRRAGGAARAGGLALAGLAGLALALSLLWTAAPVARGGMAPALLPGDLALLRRAPLAVGRGDVVAFRLPGEDAPRIARVIGLPGERVAVEGGAPVIDGRAVPQAPEGWWGRPFRPEGPRGVMPVCAGGAVGLGAECLARALREALPGGRSALVLDAGPRPLDRSPEVLVPPGALYVLGDARDGAEDSRRAPGAGGTGLVPLAALLGRVDRVLASSSALRPWDPRGWRPGRTLARVR